MLLWSSLLFLAASLSGILLIGPEIEAVLRSVLEIVGVLSTFVAACASET